MAGGAPLRRSALLTAVRLGGMRFAPAIEQGMVADLIEPVQSALLAAGLDGPFVVHLGPPRANRKPVAVAFVRGKPRAIVKVGTNQLTNRLVANEASALAEWGRRRHSLLFAPDLLAAGEVAGCQFNVQSLLPLASGISSLPLKDLVPVTSEIAGELKEAAIPDSDWWVSLQSRLLSLPEDADAELLTKLIQSWLADVGDLVLPFGGWHGDFTPWNCAVVDQLYVWDWERFGGPVVVGCDGLHYLFARHLAGGKATLEAATDLVVEARRLLPNYDLSGAQIDAAIGGYLIEIATRYATDRQRAAGARVGRLDEWFPTALRLSYAR